MTDEPQAYVSGGRSVARALKSEGVDVIYTVGGDHLAGLYDGCTYEGIEVVHVRHAQVAAQAADGYARSTGLPGCAAVPAGRDTTDALPGVANAFRAGSPLLLVGGRKPLSGGKTGTLQDLTGTHLMGPVTKYAARVPDAARATGMVSTAFRECYNGVPGPSFLEISCDVLDSGAPAERAGVQKAAAHRTPTRSPGDPEAVEKLAGLLVRAQKPTILLGGQVRTVHGTDAAVELIRSLNIPAYLTGSARGSLPPGDPHHFQHARRYAFANADLIVVVGTPFDLRTDRDRRLSPHATVVRIDLDPGTTDEDQGTDLSLVGDPGLVLSSVSQAAGSRPDNGSVQRKPWLDELRAAENTALEMRLPHLRSDASPVHPYRLAGEINDFLTADSVFVGDAGDIVTLAGHVIQPKSAGHWMDPGPLGTPGTGIPFVLAAKKARPDKEVVALLDDKAFTTTGWDFETLVRHHLPFVGIVGGNAPANRVRRGRRPAYGDDREHAGDSTGGVPYDKFAQMLGGYGEEVREAAGIAPALRRARESGLPSLVNVWVDPDAYAPSTTTQTMYK